MAPSTHSNDHKTLQGSCVGVLSLEEVRRTVSKLLVFGFRGKSLDAHAQQLVSMGAGGVILFSRNFESPEQVAKLCKELKQEAKSRLVIMVDQEGGIISRLGPPFTPVPMAQVIGDTKDPTSAACIGRIIGRELRAVNIDMNLAPVLDVNTNPMNSVIKGRSFGRLPNLVADFGCAFIESLQKEGVAACAKHYPGHGDTIKDSHFGLPFLGHTLKRLEKVELFPFSKAIGANVAAVMVGHICVPALDVSNSLSKSQTWPATMSKGAISYLRKRLLFEGVVISDCMEMGAITKNYSIGDACVKAVLAGVDMVLISHTKRHQIAAISSLVNAVLDGRLPFERIKEAECRINNLMNNYVTDASDVIQMASRNSMHLFTQAGRRNVMYEDSDTYVLIEPDQDERFVTLEELRVRLKGWLEKWPGTEIPADLDKFTDIEEAVAYLIESVCELEIGGGLGSIQWYKVRLQAS